MDISRIDNFFEKRCCNRGHAAKELGGDKIKEDSFFLRLERVEQMIFWKDPQSRESKVIEKVEMNVIKGTGEGTASGRNLEILRIAFHLGLM